MTSTKRPIFKRFTSSSSSLLGSLKSKRKDPPSVTSSPLANHTKDLFETEEGEADLPKSAPPFQASFPSQGLDSFRENYVNQNIQISGLPISENNSSLEEEEGNNYALHHVSQDLECERLRGHEGAGIESTRSGQSQASAIAEEYRRRRKESKISQLPDQVWKGIVEASLVAERRGSSERENASGKEKATRGCFSLGLHGLSEQVRSSLEHSTSIELGRSREEDCNSELNKVGHRVDSSTALTLSLVNKNLYKIASPFRFITLSLGSSSSEWSKQTLFFMDGDNREAAQNVNSLNFNFPNNLGQLSHSPPTSDINTFSSSFNSLGSSSTSSSRNAIKDSLRDLFRPLSKFTNVETIRIKHSDWSTTLPSSLSYLSLMTLLSCKTLKSLEIDWRNVPALASLEFREKVVRPASEGGIGSFSGRPKSSTSSRRESGYFGFGNGLKLERLVIRFQEGELDEADANLVQTSTFQTSIRSIQKLLSTQNTSPGRSTFSTSPSPSPKPYLEFFPSPSSTSKSLSATTQNSPTTSTFPSSITSEHSYLGSINMNPIVLYFPDPLSSQDCQRASSFAKAFLSQGLKVVLNASGKIKNKAAWYERRDLLDLGGLELDGEVAELEEKEVLYESERDGQILEGLL